MMPTDLDRYDLKILAALRKNAAISNQELADRIGLSPSPCSRRSSSWRKPATSCARWLCLTRTSSA